MSPEEEGARKFAIGFMVVCFLGMCTCAFVVTDTDPSALRTPGVSEAFVMSHAFVEAKLISPSTAKFPWGPSASNPIVGVKGGYRILAYVDSQNGYGATVRTRYECKMYYNAQRKSWTCGNLRLHD